MNQRYRLIGAPELKAVLANEEVVDGKSEIGGHPVVRKTNETMDVSYYGLR